MNCIPTQGLHQIEPQGQPSYTVDDGDGTCDALASITIGKVVREIEL